MILLRRFTYLTLFAVAASARPTLAPKNPNEFNAIVQERDALIRGAILNDRSAEYAIVTAKELGMVGQRAFAVINGGVDPLTSDCLCLRPGNAALQGTGTLSRSTSTDPVASPSTVLRGSTTALRRAEEVGFGLPTGGSRADYSPWESQTPDLVAARSFAILSVGGDVAPAAGGSSELTLATSAGDAGFNGAAGSRGATVAMRGEGGTYNTGLLSGGGSLTAGPPEAGGSALLAASDSKASLGVNGWGISALLLPGTAAGEESLMATPALSRFEISSKPPMTATTVTAASFGTQNERSFLTPKDSLVRNTLRFYEAANDKGEGESASSPPASAPTGGGGGFVVPVAKAVIAGDGSSVTSFVPLFAKAFEQSPARAPAPGIDVENTSRVADDNRFESSSPPSASSEGHSGQSYEASANEDRSAISALSHGADLTVAAHEHHEDEWREGDYHAASLPGSPAVPEPATGVLLLMGGLAILFGKVRR